MPDIRYVRVPPCPASTIHELKKLLQRKATTILEVGEFLEDEAECVRQRVDIPAVRQVFEQELREVAPDTTAEEMSEILREEVHSLESDVIKGQRIHLITNPLLRDIAITNERAHRFFNPIASYLLSQILPGTGVFGTCYVATIDYDTQGLEVPYGDVSLTRVAELVRDAVVVDAFHRADGIVPMDKEMLQRLEPAEVQHAGVLRYLPKYGVGFKVTPVMLNESHATVDGLAPVTAEDVPALLKLLGCG